MTAFDALLALQVPLFLLSVASAIVARQGASDARAALRRCQNDLHELGLELDRVRAAIRRIEGRQTARMTTGREPSLDSNPVAPGGLPDPEKDPEKWRAAVRLLGLQQQRNRSDGNTFERPDEIERGTLSANGKDRHHAPPPPIGGSGDPFTGSPARRRPSGKVG